MMRLHLLLKTHFKIFSIICILLFWHTQGITQEPVSNQISDLLEKASGASSDSAIQLYNLAIEIGNRELKAGLKSGNKDLRTQLVKANLRLGLVYYQKLDYERAMQKYILALSLANELKDPNWIAESQFSIAEVYLEQNRYGDAMDKYTESLGYYEKAGDASGRFWCYTGMGIVQKQSGNLNDAVVCYEKALEVALKARLSNETASCYNNLGNVYRKKGDFSKAMEAYQKAIDSFKALKNDIAASDCMNNIGNLYLDNGDPFRALDYYSQSLRIVKEHDDRYRLTIRYKNMAGAYTDLKDYDNALQFLNDALALAEKGGDKSYTASCYMQFGKLHAKKNNPGISLAYYKKAVAIFQYIGAKIEKAEALVEMALVELDQGQTEAAIGHADEAMQLASDCGSMKIQMDAALCLSKANERIGNEKTALKYLNIALQFKDSIYSVEKYRTIEEVEAGFLQHELKKQNEMLAQNSELQKQAIRTRNIILLLLFFCLVLSAALIWLIYKRQKEARRETGRVREISEQKIGQLSEDLTIKERELTSKTIFINQKNQLLERMIGELDELKKTDSAGNVAQHIQQQLKQELSPNAWKEFEVQFNEVHPGFQSRLLEQFPELTPAERRLCSFIRLDMNTREISSLTGQSTKSIEVARTRIRKKLNVPHEYNLTNFIAKL